MPIFITDPEVVGKMAEIEGKDWAKDQGKDNGYSVASFLKEYRAVEAGESDCNAHGILRVDDNSAIYGNGGWNRYFVLANTGEVFLSRSHSRKEVVAKAESLGIAIWG